MKHTCSLLAVLYLTAVAPGTWAQTSTAPKPKKHASAQPAISAADVQALKDAIASQQQQIQQLSQQVQQNQQAWQQAQQQLQQAQQQVQQAQSAASDVQQKVSSVQAASDQQQTTVAKLSSDIDGVKNTMTNSVVAQQDEQKRFSALESAFGRFRFSGDMRVRGENYNQQGVPDRNRGRVRGRFGIDGRLGEDFVGGLYVATGSLGDPTTTNETLTNFFDRKTIGLDRAYITYNPVAAKWLSLTGGKFAFPWQRTSLTFDPDINPDGFDAKLSFDLHKGAIKNFTVQGMLLPFNEVTKGPDSFVVGGNMSARFQFGPWTTTPSYTVLNVHNPDALLSASAFATQATTTGSQTTGSNNGNVPGEGPGCATIQNVPSPASLSFAPCPFAANGMTNATYVTLSSSGVPTAHFLSAFLYSDFLLNNQIKTGIARLPINFFAEYEQNLSAHPNPYDIHGNPTSLSRQDKSYGFDFSVGQAINTFSKNEFQVGYSWWRIEQDAILASWAESDQRAPTNILQNRIYGGWRIQKSVLAQYTMWIGRTLNSGLENNAASINKTISTAGAKEPTLKRQQFDLVYTF